MALRTRCPFIGGSCDDLDRGWRVCACAGIRVVDFAYLTQTAERPPRAVHLMPHAGRPGEIDGAAFGVTFGVGFGDTLRSAWSSFFASAGVATTPAAMTTDRASSLERENKEASGENVSHLTRKRWRRASGVHSASARCKGNVVRFPRRHNGP